MSIAAFCLKAKNKWQILSPSRLPIPSYRHKDILTYYGFLVKHFLTYFALTHSGDAPISTPPRVINIILLGKEAYESLVCHINIKL